MPPPWKNCRSAPALWFHVYHSVQWRLFRMSNNSTGKKNFLLILIKSPSFYFNSSSERTSWPNHRNDSFRYAKSLARFCGYPARFFPESDVMSLMQVGYKLPEPPNQFGKYICCSHQRTVFDTPICQGSVSVLCLVKVCEDIKPNTFFLYLYFQVMKP